MTTLDEDVAKVDKLVSALGEEATVQEWAYVAGIMRFVLERAIRENGLLKTEAAAERKDYEAELRDAYREAQDLRREVESALYR